MEIIQLLQILIGVIVFIMFLLIAVYFYLSRPKQVIQEESIFYKSPEEGETKSGKKAQNYGRFQTQLTEESIMNFLDFDEIVDNMILRKNKTQYVMVLQCSGINYDLMSENEKNAVEQGFVQFLNTLRYPVQIYVQSRTLNLKDIISEYKERIDEIQKDIEKLKVKIKQAKENNNKPLLEKLEFERRRKESVLSYGSDITGYVERLNSNRNILQQKTYLVVSYYTSELGENITNYAKEEIDSMCFSELYTRCQNLSSSLASSEVSSRILSSEELVELLYVAYNREGSEMYGLERALEAEYDSLYSTGKDILKKKQETLDKEISLAAIDLATDSILRADKQKQQEDYEKRKERAEKIKERAAQLVDNYEDQLNPRVFEIAKQNIENSIKIDDETKKIDVTEKNDLKKSKSDEKKEGKKVVKKISEAQREKAPLRKTIKKKTTEE